MSTKIGSIYYTNELNNVVKFPSNHLLRLTYT